MNTMLLILILEDIVIFTLSVAFFLTRRRMYRITAFMSLIASLIVNIVFFQKGSNYLFLILPLYIFAFMTLITISFTMGKYKDEGNNRPPSKNARIIFFTFASIALILLVLVVFISIYFVFLK